MKNAIVTGASGNLGQAVIKKLLAENYRVIGTIIPNDPVAIDTSSDHFQTEVVDLMDENNAHEFTERIIAKYNSIETAILTVGGFAMGKIAETKTADILHQVKLNFQTTYNVARPVFMQMMKQGYGRIFLIGSRTGIDMRNSKGMVAYGLSKSLIFRLAELMNDEAKGKNVVVNVIAPSTIDTPQNRKSMPDADYSKWVTAEAIADVIYFYAGEEGKIIREPVIKVYGDG
jgi:NAD(P)-dependent dehydrogenase (short-subunit alcohol dehydrogenase family)